MFTAPATPLMEFQSTPPARGATKSQRVAPSIKTISIHAPREGGDLTEQSQELTRKIISIHAPREGGDGVAVSPPCLV